MSDPFVMEISIYKYLIQINTEYQNRIPAQLNRCPELPVPLN